MNYKYNKFYTFFIFIPSWRVQRSKTDFYTVLYRNKCGMTVSATVKKHEIKLQIAKSEFCSK